jgi:ubiquitin C-terminal hydrolase
VRILSDEQYEETPQAVFDEHSIPHLVFSHQIYDRFVCQMCLYKGEWDLYSNLLFTTYATDFYSKRFEDMENMLANMAQSRDVNPSCDLNGCKGKHSKERVIRRFPMVFAISILWATDSATKNQVEGLFNNLKERVDLAKAFVADGPAYKFRYGGARTTYRMRGFVCYYGKHYVAFFYSTAHKMWLLFDDNRVLEIGPWETVVSE